MSVTAIKTIEEATGMSPEEITQVWEKMKESPFQKVIRYEIETRQIRESLALGTVAPDQFSKQQGIVQGLQIVLGILARPPNVRSPLSPG